MAQNEISLLVMLLGCTVACGGTTRRFPLREPVWRDHDTGLVHIECHPDPEPKKDSPPNHRLCLPEEYESPFAWDVADNTVFRPLAKLFAVQPGGESVNVNSMDEVPDSAWFQNRFGRREMTVEQVIAGSCGEAWGEAGGGKVLDPKAPDGAWLVNQGKPNGANPGFRVKVEGVGKFMLKADPPDQPERATGATSIASRFYHAAGWWAPCDTIVYFRPSILKLKPGLESADNSGIKRKFDQAALDKVLAGAPKRDGLVRMVASKWLPGRPIGPFRYEGTRDDDPNDVIAHEDRRDLRGARVIAAWLNHFDSREQNTMDTWMPKNRKDAESSPGFVRHWYIDLGDCFGSEWAWEEISKRLGHSYYLDLAHVSQDFLTFGVVERPWDRAARSKEGNIFGFFRSDDFEPHEWHGGYPNPAFARMTEHDAAWAARIVARFSAEAVEAAVRVGDYTDPHHMNFLTEQLLSRQRAILRRYFARLSPIADVRVMGGSDLCATDLARKNATYPAERFRYTAALHGGRGLPRRATPVVRPSADGGLCLALPHLAADAGPPDESWERYVVVDVANGASEAPLRAHLYDLGPSRGYRLVGVERPDDASPPG